MNYFNIGYFSKERNPMDTLGDILDNIDDDWLEILYKGETKTLLDDIYKKIKNDECAPECSHIFNWCRLTSLNNIKVVILGQDPYPKKGDANGTAFSCMAKKIPGSLKNIHKCLMREQLITQPTHGDLSSWAKQGVLLLNTALTTKVGIAGHHLKLWEPYTKTAIKRISDYCMKNGRDAHSTKSKKEKKK